MAISAPYHIWGYIEYLPTEMGFVTPVFQRDDGFYVQVASDLDKIVAFERLPDRYAQIITFVDESQSNRFSRVENESCIYGFKFRGNSVRFHEANILAVALSPVKKTQFNRNIAYENAKAFVDAFNIPPPRTLEEFYEVGWGNVDLPAKMERKDYLLVMDESKAIRFMMQTILSKTIPVVTVADAISFAFYLKEKPPPRLIILDCSDEQGQAAFEILERRCLLKTVPVIVVSYLRRTDNVLIEPYASDVKAYFAKPFNPVTLTAVVADLIDRPIYDFVSKPTT